MSAPEEKALPASATDVQAAPPVASERRPMLSYDFSKWNGPDDTIRDEISDADVIEAAIDPDISFRVYTPKDIKEKPLVKSTPPAADSGLTAVTDVAQAAEAFRPKTLPWKGIGFGALGAVLAVGLVAIVASLADDTPMKSAAPALPTTTLAAPPIAPTPAPAMVTIVTAAPATEPAPAIELVDAPARLAKPRALRRVTSNASPPPVSTTKHIIRDNPY